MFTTMVSFLPSSTLIWCNCCSCWPTQHHNLKNLEFVLCVFVYNIFLGLIMNFTWEQSLGWFISTRRNLWWSRLIGLQIRCSKLYLLFLFFQRNDMCEEKEGEKKSNFTCFVIVLWAKEERVVLPDAVKYGIRYQAYRAVNEYGSLRSTETTVAPQLNQQLRTGPGCKTDIFCYNFHNQGVHHKSTITCNVIAYDRHVWRRKTVRL